MECCVEHVIDLANSCRTSVLKLFEEIPIGVINQ